MKSKTNNMENFLTQTIPAGETSFPVWFIAIGVLIAIASTTLLISKILKNGN